MTSDPEQLQKWTVDGIECYFDDPDYVRSTWAFEAYKWLQQLHTQLTNVKNQSTQPKLLKVTRIRLKKLIEDMDFQLLQLQKLLSPLGWKNVDQNSFVSYLSQQPGSSELSVHYDNIFRDWAWGHEENRLSVEQIAAVSPDLAHVQRMAVLGAGSGRLAYDLSARFKNLEMTLVDFNPFLLLVAKRILSGESLDLVEFPMVPQKADFFSVQHKLSAPGPTDDKFKFVAADVRDLPFSKSEFDAVLTPWLVDVVKADFMETLANINKLLAVGGSWVNFGPIGFNNPILADYYSYEEVLLMIEKSGFKINKHLYEPIPYLQSPYSNHHREERVLVVSATKEREISAESEKSRELFDWELDQDLPIKIPVEEMNLIAGHEFNAYIYSLIRTPVSLNDLTEQVVREKGVPPNETRYMIQQILRNAQILSLQNPQAQ